MAPENVIDELRYSYAQAASHGYGAGQVEARRLIDGWQPDEGRQLAQQILDDVDLAQAYAQSMSAPFEDYRAQLAAGTQSAETLSPDRDETLRTVYQAGFDMGFRAALVEGCAELRDGPAGFSAI